MLTDINGGAIRTPSVCRAKSRGIHLPRFTGEENQRGLRFANIRCNVRRCMFRRRAVSETLWPHSS